jgi:TQXA domain-containing protein
MLPLALPPLPSPWPCPGRPRSRQHTGRAAAILGAVVLSLGISTAPGLAADAQLLSLGAGLYDTVTGQVGSGPSITLGFTGVFHISIDGGPQTDAYCIDLLHTISITDTLPQITPNYPCEVVYILNNAFPTADNISGALDDVNLEAAAVQAAIWKFTDDFNTTAPGDVASRAGQIIAAAQNQCETVPPVPQSIDLSPASATNYIDPLYGTGDTTHTVTATLYDTGGQPIPNYPIRIVVSGAAGPQAFEGTTDGSGQFVATYANALVVTGSDTITASVTFTVPVGLEFKTLDKQGIVLAGSSRTGTVTQTATKDWVAVQCGDGLVNAPGETCDPPGAPEPNGQFCRDDCTFCGDGHLDSGEACDDGPDNSDIAPNACRTDCTLPPTCGDGLVNAPGETCDPPGAPQPNGQFCRDDCTFCGDGHLDGGEACDDGPNNSDIAPNACRTDCTLPSCGDGVIDTGETCDPPGSAQPPHGYLCRENCTVCGDGVVQPGEQCDDGNDAECDPLHPREPLNGDRCNNECAGLICRDPSKIKLTAGLDALRYHGIMVPIEGDTIDFDSGVAISLTAGQTLVFETNLPAGAVEARSSGAFNYRNRAARHDGGIWKLRAWPTRNGTYKVTAFCYGDLGQAEAEMVTHVMVSDREWTIRALWRRTATGWVFVGPISLAP